MRGIWKWRIQQKIIHLLFAMPGGGCGFWLCWAGWRTSCEPQTWVAWDSGNKERLYKALGGQAWWNQKRKSTNVLDVIFTEIVALEVKHFVHHFSKYSLIFLHFHLKAAMLWLPRPPMWPAMWCYLAAFYRRVWEHLGLAVLVVVVFLLEIILDLNKLKGVRNKCRVFAQNWLMRPA